MKSGSKGVGKVKPETAQLPKQPEETAKEKAKEAVKRAVQEALEPFEKAKGMLAEITKGPKTSAKAHSPSQPKAGELRTGGQKFQILEVPKGGEMRAIKQGYQFCTLVRGLQIYALPNDVDAIRKAVHGKAPSDVVIATK